MQSSRRQSQVGQPASQLQQWQHGLQACVAPTRFTALFVCAGIGLGAAIPALSANSHINANAPAHRQSSERISQNPQKAELLLVSYAVTKAAYDRIIPLFTAKWKQQTGQEVTINASYGGSGSQTRAILDGLEADVAALALGLDTKKLEKSGLIQPGWEKEAPNEAIVTRSVVALVTREGNPKKIRTWADLAKPGVSVITANPKTSGGARWNFLGLWGAVAFTGGTEAQAQEYVTKVYKNAPILPKDAREASDVFFKKAQGDVLLNYENEVILEGLKGATKSFYVVPQVNIAIDNPVAVVDKNVDKHGNRKVAEAFLQFLFTPEAQREFAKVGFRPVTSVVNKEVEKKFPKVNKIYTVKDFGGWDAVQKKFFDDGAVFDKIQGSPR
ncbi:sulfate ABC transporter substrate-binding protein [Pantanalinema sp. GBBB05]|uniref:sulfate ABC transporter substrate-binding protein n=1 Tax=Pantanalinema sp. GBBB05 TaxID=2604139 RepID=UPI001D241B53|nr:sulfate ABC transporter substrate-binding protein [Pantanalinema sp. GBBB05]